MTTFHVQPGGYQSLKIYVPRLGHTILFTDGSYETDDPAEIRALRRNRYVTEGYARGDSFIPRLGFYELHAGERVVPAASREEIELDEDDFGEDE